ncbi:MAG: hypothetical protein ACRD3M_16810 [Thermoanaerobaculia bacterium]
MSGVLGERRGAPVGVDHSTLKGERAGTDTRYSVALIGDLDESWSEAFRTLQADSSAFRRLRLDPAARLVSFTCRAIDGPPQVFDILERLDALIKLVNRRVSGRR